jgi:hypothetical protein
MHAMPSAHPTNCQHDHLVLHHHALRETASTRMRGNIEQRGQPPMSNHQRQTSVKISTGVLHFTLAHAYQRTQILAYSEQTVESPLSGATPPSHTKTKMSSCRRLCFYMRFTECTCSRRLQRFDLRRGNSPATNRSTVCNAPRRASQADNHDHC